jgi:branched-chain amino acid transport system ATP-binding protein
VRFLKIESSAPILKLEHVTKGFGGLLAVDDVSLEVKKNGITGLIGPNGSGKTTLFNLISGSLKPDAGKIFFENSAITGLAPHKIFRRGIYRTFQSPQIIASLTIIENMLLADPSRNGEGLFESIVGRRRWKATEKKLIGVAYEHLRFLELDKYANESPAILSGGQLKLLEIGRALMSNATILLLDEPAAGVAPSLALKIFDFLDHLRNERGVTIFVIEHKVDIVFERVDNVFVLNKGKLLASGTPKDIAANEIVIDAYLGE